MKVEIKFSILTGLWNILVNDEVIMEELSEQEVKGLTLGELAKLWKEAQA